MAIYVDVIIIENLIMNYIILFTTGMILKVRIYHFRIFIASLIGGIYAIVGYIGILELYTNVLAKIILSIVMVYISFNSNSVKKILKQLMMFYLTSFVFGGVAFALLYFVKPQDILQKNGVLIGSYPIKIVFLGAILAFVMLKIVFKWYKKRLTNKDMLCDVNIYMMNNSIKVKAYIDTGNLLKDPISQIPVMLVEEKALVNLIPEKILNNLQNILGGDRKKVENMEINTYISKIRIIPFSSLGKENGMILGIKPDYIEIIEEEVKKIKNVIIGIYDKTLTKNGSYQALVSLDLIEENSDS